MGLRTAVSRDDGPTAFAMRAVEATGSKFPKIRKRFEIGQSGVLRELAGRDLSRNGLGEDAIGSGKTRTARPFSTTVADGARFAKHSIS